MSDRLFDAFEPIGAKQWKQKIQFDLKGAEFNETLVWTSPEGIHVKPNYHSDDFDSTPGSIPGHPATWSIGQTIFIDDPQIACSLTKDALSRGAEAIVWEADQPFNLNSIAQEIELNGTPLYLKLGFVSDSFNQQLKEFTNKTDAALYLLLDPLGRLASTGNWFENQQSDLQALRTLIQDHPTLPILTVDLSIYQNAGAHMVQQLAYSLAHLNEYLNTLNLPVGSSLTLSVWSSTGPNYFFEIAKLRALRSLVDTLSSAYGIEINTHIVAEPSRRTKSIYDYNVNMLRTTTECMSAAVGGANTVVNMPYDALYHKSNEFGSRIARNQLLILKNESYFDAVSNAADGSYYVESLTVDLAKKSLDLFKKLEADGGWLAQIKEGTIQRKIKESAAKEQAQFDSEEIIMVGTNKHPNPSDKMKDNLELYPFLKKNPRKTLIEPILPIRLAEQLEQERLNDE